MLLALPAVIAAPNGAFAAATGGGADGVCRRRIGFGVVSIHRASPNGIALHPLYYSVHHFYGFNRETTGCRFRRKHNGVRTVVDRRGDIGCFRARRLWRRALRLDHGRLRETTETVATLEKCSKVWAMAMHGDLLVCGVSNWGGTAIAAALMLAATFAGDILLMLLSSVLVARLEQLRRMTQQAQANRALRRRRPLHTSGLGISSKPRRTLWLLWKNLKPVH